MPRFASDYPPIYAGMNLVISTSAFVLGAAQLIFFYNIIKTARGNGAKASDQVWEGASGLEFTLPSPPPYHTFTVPPEVK